MSGAPERSARRAIGWALLALLPVGAGMVYARLSDLANCSNGPDGMAEGAMSIATSAWLAPLAIRALGAAFPRWGSLELRAFTLAWTAALSLAFVFLLTEGPLAVLAIPALLIPVATGAWLVRRRGIRPRRAVARGLGALAACVALWALSAMASGRLAYDLFRTAPGWMCRLDPLVHEPSCYRTNCAPDPI